MKTSKKDLGIFEVFRDEINVKPAWRQRPSGRSSEQSDADAVEGQERQGSEGSTSGLTMSSGTA